MSERRNAWMLKAALVAVSAGLLSACETQSPYSAGGDNPSISGPHPQYPITAPEDRPITPAPQPAPMPSTPPPPAITSSPSGPITSQSLPPPGYTEPEPALPPSYPSAPPPPPEPAPAQYKPVAAGSVVEADGPPKIYVVKPGDHLDSIAREIDVNPKTLIELNDLKEPNKLKPGQKLKGQPTRGKAYVVQSGDTLSAIGRRFSVTSAALAEANDFKTSESLHPGRKVLLPRGYKDIGPGQVLVQAAEAPTPAYSRPTPEPVPAPRLSPPVAAAMPAPAAPAAPAAQNPAAQAANGGPCTAAQQLPTPLPPGFPSAAQLKELAQGKFSWPVRGGKVVACYGPQPTHAIGLDQKAGVGVINNGIDITANPNTAVRASAAGEIIHADQVTGSGLTVLIQHPNGWITIYGNLSSLSVPRRDVAVAPVDESGKAVPRTKVSQGQEIGRSGGSADGQAMVHFEVRYSKDGVNPRPIDPELILPAR